MKINCKEGVWFKFIDDRFLKLAAIVFHVYHPYGIIPTVTSACDGKHGKNSYHPDGLAWDWRIWKLPEEDLPNIADKIRKKAREISPRYDVVYGDEKHRDHIHTEFDVRKQI